MHFMFFCFPNLSGYVEGLFNICPGYFHCILMFFNVSSKCFQCVFYCISNICSGCFQGISEFSMILNVLNAFQCLSPRLNSFKCFSRSCTVFEGVSLFVCYVVQYISIVFFWVFQCVSWFVNVFSILFIVFCLL